VLVVANAVVTTVCRLEAGAPSRYTPIGDTAREKVVCDGRQLKVTLPSDSLDGSV